MNSTVIHWFRKGLRIHDNPALKNAIAEAENKKSYLRPIFVLDPEIRKWLRVGSNRWRFLIQALDQLNDNLKGINTRLYVVRGCPEEIFPYLFNEWNVTMLTFEADIEPYAIRRDENIETLANKNKVEIVQRISHTLYDVNNLVVKNGGQPPLTYQQFLSIVQNSEVKHVAQTPKNVAQFCQPPSDAKELSNPNCYNVPTYQELDVDELMLGPCKFPGGETEGLRRMEEVLQKKEWICKFEKPNTSPNSISPSTTVLSPYLKFGCLSIRLFYHRLKEIEKNRAHTKPPVSLMGQIMWREFYYTVAAATPNFDKMEGNPICCQIPWKKNDEHLILWAEGKTGYPFVDAIMRQLKQEGWIHHLARHMVACFLTRGDLWISWEDGQRVFEEYLLDADWALNAGNWMWLSASAFFHQYFRVYSPISFGKKTDKFGNYIRKYVPELKKYPSEFIYEPWKAPKKLQQVAGCIVGQDYPERIVVHEIVSKENITKMSLAYKSRKEEVSGVKRKIEAVDLKKSR